MPLSGMVGGGVRFSFSLPVPSLPATHATTRDCDPPSSIEPLQKEGGTPTPSLRHLLSTDEPCIGKTHARSLGRGTSIAPCAEVRVGMPLDPGQWAPNRAVLSGDDMTSPAARRGRFAIRVGGFELFSRGIQLYRRLWLGAGWGVASWQQHENEKISLVGCHQRKSQVPIFYPDSKLVASCLKILKSG